MRITKKDEVNKQPEKIKYQEYDEVICRKCEKVLNVKKTLTMVDGYNGYCLCPSCGKRNHVVKTRPADDDYKVLKGGQRVRKIKKLKMSKKQKRKLNKELRSNKV